MSPFYGNLGIRGEKTGHEREISGDFQFNFTQDLTIAVGSREGSTGESEHSRSRALRAPEKRGEETCRGDRGD